MCRPPYSAYAGKRSHAVYGPWNTPLRNLQKEGNSCEDGLWILNMALLPARGFYEAPRMVQDDPLRRNQIMINIEGATKNKII